MGCEDYEHGSPVRISPRALHIAQNSVRLSVYRPAQIAVRNNHPLTAEQGSMRFYFAVPAGSENAIQLFEIAGGVVPPGGI